MNLEEFKEKVNEAFEATADRLHNEPGQTEQRTAYLQGFMDGIAVIDHLLTEVYCPLFEEEVAR